MRLFGICVLAGLMLVMISNVTAQKITLRRSFWNGSQYSIDGVKFEKIGIRAEGLREIMADEPGALKKLDSYKWQRNLGNFFLVVGGVLVTVPVVAWIANKEWTSKNTAFFRDGVPACALALVFKASAAASLKDAVDIHNRNEDLSAPQAAIGLYLAPDQRTPGLMITFSF
ncbi:MAG TPA: hypothetical protein VJ983_07295 [candidate division Zixibacteria bacterium]|nr:hypothetical protein [candidate division Zixibacteria bacterium]